jgi:hypothetical protein
MLVRFAQKKYQFALHSIRVLNHHEGANHSRFPFTIVRPARAECLTLTFAPSSLGRAASLVHGRHPRGPFATPRARFTVTHLRMSFAHSNRSGLRMI